MSRVPQNLINSNNTTRYIELPGVYVMMLLHSQPQSLNLQQVPTSAKRSEHRHGSFDCIFHCKGVMHLVCCLRARKLRFWVHLQGLPPGMRAAMKSRSWLVYIQSQPHWNSNGSRARPWCLDLYKESS